MANCSSDSLHFSTASYTTSLQMIITIMNRLLTAFNRQGGNLKSQHSARRGHRGRQREMRAKHQSDSRVLPPNVGFSFPQLNVRVPELQDAGTVNSTTEQRQGQRLEIITHRALCPTQGSIGNRAMKQKKEKYPVLC